MADPASAADGGFGDPRSGRAPAALLARPAEAVETLAPPLVAVDSVPAAVAVVVERRWWRSWPRRAAAARLDRQSQPPSANQIRINVFDSISDSAFDAKTYSISGQNQ